MAAAPKPGLVDRLGPGSHDDMDFMTFADSALALAPAFAELARAGFVRGAARPAWALAAFRPGKPVPEDIAREDAECLAALRRIGVEGEARMFAATGGVNTHKGALFLLGLQAAAAGALLGAGAVPDADRVRALGARLVSGLSARELPGAQTNGARAFRAHGSRGVRGEAESALASLDAGALAILRSARRSGSAAGDEVCVEALLSIMAVCDDTTVLHRGGSEALDLVRTGARSVLDSGGVRTQKGRAELAWFSAALVSKKISPGGSADALAAGLFLTETERSFSPS